MLVRSRIHLGVANLDGAAVFVNHGGERLFVLENDEHVRRTIVFEYFPVMNRPELC